VDGCSLWKLVPSTVEKKCAAPCGNPNPTSLIVEPPIVGKVFYTLLEMINPEPSDSVETALFDGSYDLPKP